MPEADSPRFRVNDRVQVARLDGHGGEEDRAHTYVESLEEDAVHLPIPSRGGALLYFAPGAAVALYVTEDDALYRAECEVLGVRRRRRIPMMMITPPAEFARVQRRSHVRWDCSLPVHWRARTVKSDGDEDGEEGDAVTVNISCGGMLCAGSRPLQEEREYEFVISLSRGETITCRGEVVRTGRADRGDETTWAVNFTQISVTDQDRIRAFIFEEQLKMRRLGLL